MTGTLLHLAVDKGDAVPVASQLSNRLRAVLTQHSSVPHLAQRVVAAREQQLGGAVSECHCIHVILVSIDLAKCVGGEALCVRESQPMRLCGLEPEKVLGGRGGRGGQDMWQCRCGWEVTYAGRPAYIQLTSTPPF